MLPLAQSAPDAAPYPYDPSYGPEVQFGLLDLLFGLGCSCGWWIVYLPLMIWMAVSCIRRDPERYLWIWIIVFVPLGPVIYLLARWLPSSDLKPPKFLHRWTRSREINRLQIAANQIGNAHQYVELGDALRETGQTEEAAAAYAKALARDNKNLQALWGGACVDFNQQKLEAAREKLATILASDPAYKFGDVSLLQGKVLHALGQTEQARDHLEKHTRRWRHPEGVYLLATIYADNGEPRLARDQLNGLIQDLEGGPRAIVRKHQFWKGRARKLLRRLPSA
ncbi:MAG: hypothetical protein DWQ34_13750 [Planctomycetota bacterium]|nr:MAG: hypothetical protein DWQ29_20145 [Planctomycetota bacterium]REJ91972.1 MAG: hypothetical protein DWQ34_13750 [Planctomycetota bacterium]REK27241.1 MAG: hypothetical protein DWQ41_07665 [Planctomycetota bacterium]REK36737.1 MAG: hypothetical protein DWQ45_08970 [Planctomycetota bacterium]